MLTFAWICDLKHKPTIPTIKNPECKIKICFGHSTSNSLLAYYQSQPCDKERPNPA
jgi:hypothetical protein